MGGVIPGGPIKAVVNEVLPVGVFYLQNGLPALLDELVRSGVVAAVALRAATAAMIKIHFFMDVPF
jgi:hypothetical protein